MLGLFYGGSKIAPTRACQVDSRRGSRGWIIADDYEAVVVELVHVLYSHQLNQKSIFS